MKKYSFILLSMLAATSVWAQDTVQSPLMENYLINGNPEFGKNWMMAYVPLYGDRCGVVTKEVVVQEEIKVYGVAACMMTDRDEAYCPGPGIYGSEQGWWDNFWSEFRDTTTDECYEYLGIYFRNVDSLVPQREVLVHRRDDTPAYYVETGKYWRNNPNFVYPMYEKYFETPIAVNGTFYVGVTERSQQSTIGVSVYDHMDFRPMGITGLGVHEYHVSKYCWPEEGSVHWIFPPRPEMQDVYYLLFPILTPDPDNPGNEPGEEPGEEPGDTTGVTAADMVSRYVTVQPNPATEEARVLSSFGIEGVEVFDAEGRRVAELRGEGLEARIDVRGWAAGSYLLRVATPLGATTKKLLVR